MRRYLIIFIYVLFLAVSFGAYGKEKVNEPVIEFTHRYMDIHLTMKFSKLKMMNYLMPAGLRREIGQEYYPEIRRQLSKNDSMRFKDGEATIERFPDGKVKLRLKFPVFVMVVRDASWEDLDAIFAEYFGYKPA